MKLVKGPAIFDEDDQLYHVKVWKDNPKTEGVFIAVNKSALRCLDIARILMALWEAANPEFNISDKTIEDILNDPEC